MKRGMLMACALVLSACTQAEQAPEGTTAKLAAAPEPEVAARAMVVQRAGGSAVVGAPDAAVSPGQGRPAPTGRMIIRNGSIELEVASVEVALTALRAEVVRAGGYLSDESQTRGDGSIRRASVTLRLPAGSLDASLGRIQTIGRVESVNITGEDITEQYFNLEIQLQNQQQLEKRLLALLERPTNKLTELLEIEREVARVRGEIDQMEGRKRFWDSQVSFSRLVVTLHEPVPIGQGGGVIDTLRNAFREAMNNFVRAVAGLIALTGALIPVVVALGAVWWVVRRWWRRRKR